MNITLVIFNILFLLTSIFPDRLCAPQVGQFFHNLPVTRGGNGTRITRMHVDLLRVIGSVPEAIRA